MSRIRLRRGTAAQWTAVNPVLADGEMGWDKTVNKLKIGNGITAWNLLPYMVAESASASTNGGASLIAQCVLPYDVYENTSGNRRWTAGVGKNIILCDLASEYPSAGLPDAELVRTLRADVESDANNTGGLRFPRNGETGLFLMSIALSAIADNNGALPSAVKNSYALGMECADEDYTNSSVAAGFSPDVPSYTGRMSFASQFLVDDNWGDFVCFSGSLIIPFDGDTAAGYIRDLTFSATWIPFG